MKYTININQFAIVQAGLNFDLVDGAIFDMLVDYTHLSVCSKKEQDGLFFYNVPYAKVLEALPICGLKTPDSVYRRYKKLEQCGVIELHPENKKRKTVWFCWGRNYDRLKFEKKPQNLTGLKSEVSELSVLTSDLNPAVTGLKSEMRPDGNPPHYNTLSNSTTGGGKRENAENAEGYQKMLDAVEADLAEYMLQNPSTKTALPVPAAQDIFDVAAEVKRMESDAFLLAEFHQRRRVPAEKYPTYLSAFHSQVLAIGEGYPNRKKLRLHFLSWSENRLRIETETKPGTVRFQSRKTKPGAPSQFGGNASKYSEPQVF